MALTEQVQKNIETARANEIAARGHDVELQKIDFEKQKLMHGGHADADAARAAAAEQTQANIEKARANELAGRQHDAALAQIPRDEERSKREHEIAMNPPPAPAPKAASGEPKAGAPQNGDMADHPAIAEIKHVVSDLSEKVHAPHPVMLEISKKLDQLANRPRPIAAKRSKDGLRLVFDEAASPEKMGQP